jgi:5-(carboxyamino)imidazole ribonucleotide mutase
MHSTSGEVERDAIIIIKGKNMKFVSIVMGSKSDYGIMQECGETLKKFGVPYELIISSAHRSPERTKNYIKEAEAKGAQVFIAAAGMAAHLAGALAASTTKPILGVGAVNAAYLAIQIMALEDDELKVKLQEDRISKAKKVELDSSEIETIL